MLLLEREMHPLTKAKCFAELFQLPNGKLKITLDDRGDIHLYENNLDSFFGNFKARCSCLTQALGTDFVHFLEPMVKLINDDTDEISTFHQSIYPIKTPFNLKKLGRFTLTQLDQNTFDKYRAAHTLSRKVTAENYPEGYRLLLISEERAKRVPVHQHHQFFDRLDEIYSNHGLIVHLLQHYSDTNYQVSGSWATDNFPDASASGASKLRKVEIGQVNSTNMAAIEAILVSLNPAVFFRLLLRSEFHAKGNFARLIFLRSLIDPILEKNDGKISEKAKQESQDKTEIQANFILKILANNGSTSSHGLSNMEIVEFLKMRNAIIHPSPNTDLKRLHLLFDKLSSFRILVYAVVFGTLVENNARQEDLFTVAVQP